MSTAQFGIYVFDMANASASNGGRSPIYDDPNYWDILARPVKMRAEPPNLASPIHSARPTPAPRSARSTSTTRRCSTIPQGSVVKVRLIEGFSGEEGGVDMFGTTEFDGQSKYGEIPLQTDGSFAADVPANVPLHIQLVDKFGMAVERDRQHTARPRGTPVANEDIWFSRPRGRVALLRRLPREPHGALVDHARRDRRRRRTGRSTWTRRAPMRVSTTAYVLDGSGNLPAGTNAANPGDNGIRGVPWDLAIQPILDKHCISCHDGTAGSEQPELHGHRHDQRHVADLHLRPARPEAERHGRRADDGRLHRLVPLAHGPRRDPGRRRRQHHDAAGEDALQSGSARRELRDGRGGRGEPAHVAAQPAAALPGRHHDPRLRSAPHSDGRHEHGAVHRCTAPGRRRVGPT